MARRIRSRWLFAAVLVLGLAHPGSTDGALAWRGVWEWSLDHGTESGLVAIADACKSLGFNALMMSPPRDKMAFMAQACHARGVRLYLSTVFSGGDSAWQQVMTAAEQARASKPVPATHQHGGEPRDPGEVFEGPLPCWNRPEVRAYFRKLVQDNARLPVDGLAFDYAGYANYYRCYCRTCEVKLAEYRKLHRELNEQDAAARMAEDALVGFINEMAAAARKVRPDIGLTIHVYPYFGPDPYYGNRLQLDTVGETVSWFFRPHWPLSKVRRLTGAMVATQHQFVPTCTAAPFIGFYDKPPADFRSARRIAAELAIIRDGGASALQIAELGSLLREPTVAEAVAKALGGSFRAAPRSPLPRQPASKHRSQ